MGNVIGGVDMDSVEALTVKELMEKDASAMAGDSRYYVREDEQGVPRRQAGCVKYLPGADMDVAVCSVCGLPIHGAVWAGKNGEDVHIGCVPSISIASAHKEVRPLLSRRRRSRLHAALQNTSREYAVGPSCRELVGEM
jgi:hypothetical protein